MNALNSVGLTICYVCIAVSILSALVPGKRMRRMMSFVIGIFLIGTVISAFSTEIKGVDLSVPQDVTEIPTYNEKDYEDTVAQMTADHLTESLNELLLNEGIAAEDIRLTLKISDKGRISAERVIIYISEAYRERTRDIESIIYRNISKEPEIYVTGQKNQRMAE